LHLSPFQVVSRGGREPGPFDGGWKDTVDLRSAEHIDVAIRFTDYQGPYVLQHAYCTATTLSTRTWP
jgi:FtsP/CotA-like multicopper oxidase with cupredoxin domain